MINDLASTSHALNRQRQSVRTARCRAPRAAAGDTDASGDSKFTNADAFKVLEAIGGDNALKKASSPFGGNGGASNPFAASATRRSVHRRVHRPLRRQVLLTHKGRRRQVVIKVR